LGNPAAGIQEVWITYTSESGSLHGTWQSIDLVQNSSDSTLWEGTLNIDTTNLEDFRYLVQAVNGVGLVSISTNLGLSYIPGLENPDPAPSELSIDIPGSSAAYGTQVSLSAVLTSGGTPLQGELLRFRLGNQVQQGFTNASGRATVQVPLLGLPGSHEASATYSGSADYSPASDSGPFTITRQTTSLSLQPNPAKGTPAELELLTATLSDREGKPLSYQTVFFVLDEIGGASGVFSSAVITDYAGRAVLGELPLSPGEFQVNAYFGGTIPLPGAAITLEDVRYEPAIASASLTLEKEIVITILFLSFPFTPTTLLP
jgi:hypothetical protein